MRNYGYISITNFGEPSFSRKNTSNSPWLTIRYDYTHATRKFVIRMSSFVHDTMAAEIGGELLSDIKQIKRWTDPSKKGVVAIAERLIATGSSKITIPLRNRRNDKKAPDASFQHRDCQFPGLVIEVAWSQRRLDLPDLANRYILGSNGEIRTVIGVNLNDIYKAQIKGAKATPTYAPATFSVWQAERDDPASQRVTVRTSVQDQVLPLYFRCNN